MTMLKKIMSALFTASKLPATPELQNKIDLLESDIETARQQLDAALTSDERKAAKKELKTKTRTLAQLTIDHRKGRIR